MLLYLQRVFFCLSTYFLILPCFSFPSKSLSEAVYPPSACPPLAKALISHTLSILHKSSHLLSYTPCPHLLKESLSLSHTHGSIRPSPLHTHTPLFLLPVGDPVADGHTLLLCELVKEEIRIRHSGLQKCDLAALPEGFKCSFSFLCPHDGHESANLWTPESAILLLNLRM